MPDGLVGGPGSLPTLDYDESDPVREETVVRVLRAEYKGRQIDLYTGRTEMGIVVSGILGEGGTSGCYPRLGHFAVSVCGAGSSSNSPDVQVTGRTILDATSIEARYLDGDPVRVR